MELEKIVVIVDAKLDTAKAEAGDFDDKDYSAWRTRHDLAVAKLQRELKE